MPSIAGANPMTWEPLHRVVRAKGMTYNYRE